MTQCESCVSCINIKKISKIKNISQNKTLEREREKGEKKVSFFDDFTRFFQSELGRLGVKAALRDESYA